MRHFGGWSDYREIIYFNMSLSKLIVIKFAYEWCICGTKPG